MVQLVSLQQASDHIRRDTNYDDNDLIDKIGAASEAVLNYITNHSFLNTTGEPDFDSAEQPIGVPRPIQQAVLILVGLLYVDRDSPDYRDGKTAPRLGDITLPRTVHFLLDPYRRPVVCQQQENCDIE